MLGAAIASLPARSETSPPKNFSTPPPARPDWRATLDTSFTAASEGKFEGLNRGDSGARNVNLNLSKTISLAEDWALDISLSSVNLWLDTLEDAPVPGEIHTLQLRPALQWQLNQRWQLRAFPSLSLYRFDNIGSDDIGAAGGLVASYQANPGLNWSFGFVADPDSDLEIFPMVGARWQINDRYLLEAGIPRTRLSYQMNPKLKLYAGANMVATTFRSANDLGTPLGLLAYNHALATYRDVRAGVGAGWRFSQHWNAELEAGYSVYRALDFSDADEKVRFRPSPYVRLGLNFLF